MKIESKQIICDTCKVEIFYEGTERQKVDRFEKLEISINGKSGTYCSLQCFVLGGWNQSIKPTDIELVENLKKVFPDWIIESPNYKKSYEDKKIKEAEEIIKNVGGYKIIKNDKQNNTNMDIPILTKLTPKNLQDLQELYDKLSEIINRA